MPTCGCYGRAPAARREEVSCGNRAQLIGLMRPVDWVAHNAECGTDGASTYTSPSGSCRCGGNMSAPTPGLRDERLCWLAVEDKLRRRSMRGTGFFIGLSSLVRSADVAFGAPDTVRGFASAKMRKYAVAVDIVA